MLAARRNQTEELAMRMDYNSVYHILETSQEGELARECSVLRGQHTWLQPEACGVAGMCWRTGRSIAVPGMSQA